MVNVISGIKGFRILLPIGFWQERKSTAIFTQPPYENKIYFKYQISKSSDKMTEPLYGVSLRAPERCVAISLQETRLFPPKQVQGSNDNLCRRISGISPLAFLIFEYQFQGRWWKGDFFVYWHK